MAKHTSKKPVHKSRVRSVKIGRGEMPHAAASPSTPLSVQKEFHRWLSKWLHQTDRLAADFCRDFLKSRRKDTNSSGVRARIQSTLERYAAQADDLRTAFRAIPDAFRPYITESEARGGDAAWIAGKHIADCLDRIHAEIERQRASIAAPMSRSEEKRFWRSTESLLVSMQKVREACKAVRKLIAEKSDDAVFEELKQAGIACQRICNEIGLFCRTMGTKLPGSSTDKIRDVQDAASFYRQQLANVGENLEKARMTGPELPAGLDDLESEMGFQATILDAVMCSSSLAFNLPRQAFDDAQEIRKIVSRALRDNIVLAAKAGLSTGDRLALCDSIPEEKLPEYSQLSPKPKEHEQFRVIVDALLLECDARGPNATLSRKDLEKTVVALAAHRDVTGLGSTSIWNKLQLLVNALKIVRQVEGKKSVANQNASDGFRLSVPAQSKYANHAPAVRAEWELIEALPALADSAD